MLPDLVASLSKWGVSICEGLPGEAKCTPRSYRTRPGELPPPYDWIPTAQREKEAAAQLQDWGDMMLRSSNISRKDARYLKSEPD